MDEIYFFGVWHPGVAGHHLHTPDGQRARFDQLPARLRPPSLDGGFCPDDTSQPQGLIRLSHVDGWTVWAAWDRTGDSRPMSSSTFVAKGILHPADMETLIGRAFPTVLHRLLAAGLRSA